MRSSVIVTMATAATAFAQTTQVQSYNSSYDMTINPGTVDDLIRGQWCRGQINTCNILCDGNTNANDCTYTDLKWNCKCASNDSRPALDEYTQTMPTFICMELFGQCQAGTNDARVHKECEDKILAKCATKNPPSLASETSRGSNGQSSTTAEASTSTTTGGSSSATNDAVTTTTSKDHAAPTLMPGNGVAAIAAIGVLAYML